MVDTPTPETPKFRALTDWGEMLCIWGDELKEIAASEDDELISEGLPTTGELFAIMISYMWSEANEQGLKEGQKKAREKAKVQVDKLKAEIEKLKAVKADQKQEALKL